MGLLDREEFCTSCGDPTGRAGNFHESLYYLDSEGEKRGPVCDDCASRLETLEGMEIIGRE